MTNPTAMKYRAFLSYSHHDRRSAGWLHGRLEGFRIDKDLVGRLTNVGPIPKSLRPIFRDRNDFSAGNSLAAETIAALEKSAALVVVCSPEAARSKYVNDEICIFKSRHPDRPIVPVIVAGRPRGDSDECFPPGLRFRIASDGTVTDHPEEVLACDLRDDGDGRELTLSKVVARLVGVDPDEIFRRAERNRRRGSRIRNGVIASLLIAFMIATSAGVWLNRELARNQELLVHAIDLAFQFVIEATALSDRVGMPAEATYLLLKRGDEALDALAKKGADTNGLKIRRAQMLAEFSRAYARLGKTTERLVSANSARKLFEELSEREPLNPLYRVELCIGLDVEGDAYIENGDLHLAASSYQNIINILEEYTKSNQVHFERSQRNLALAYIKSGQVNVLQGDHVAATKRYVAAKSLAEVILERNPNDLDLQHLLWNAMIKYGDALVLKQLFADAEEAYALALGVAGDLHANSTRSLITQQFVVITRLKLGHVLAVQEKHAAADEHLTGALSLAQNLVNLDQTNVQLQSDLSEVWESFGDALMLRKEFSGALDKYSVSLRISENLLGKDKKNHSYELRVAMGHLYVGMALSEMKRANEALKMLRKGLAIFVLHTARGTEYGSSEEILGLFNGLIALNEERVRGPN